MMHAELVKQFNSLGYSSVNGLCHGLALRWLEASLVQEESLFLKRIDKIFTYANLKTDFERVTQKKGRELTNDDLEILEIMAFFDSLAIFHSSYNYPYLANQLISQTNISHLSFLGSSVKMEALGGLQPIYFESGTYSPYELKKYLVELSALAESLKSSPQETIGFLLSSTNHSIALSYSQHAGWIFMDSNQYPPIKTTLNQLDTLIQNAFLEAKNLQLSTFSTTIITTANKDLSLLKNKLNGLSQGRVGNLEKALHPSGFMNLATLFIRQNDLVKLRQLIRCNIDVNKKNNWGAPLAYTAAEHGHAAIIAELALHGADLNKPTTNQLTTPAYIAAQNGYVDVIIELAKHRVNLDMPDKLGRTPVYIAAYCGRTAVIAELAKQGVNLNIQLSNGESPIFLAVEQGHLSTIAELAKHGANLNITDNEHNTAVHVAAQQERTAVIAELVKNGANLNAANKYNATPALIAAYDGRANIIRELAKHGANLDTATNEGMTPTFVAALQGHTAVIAALAQYGANLNKPEQNGTSPAAVAAGSGHVAVIAELAKHNVNLNSANTEGMTPAHFAAQEGHSAVIAELAKHHANLDTTNKHGISPVFMAAQHGRTAVIVQLIKHNVNLNIPFIATADELREQVGRCDIATRMRMNAFIDKKQGEDTLNISAYDIAAIMGNTKVAHLIEKSISKLSFFSPLVNKESTVRACNIKRKAYQP